MRFIERVVSGRKHVFTPFCVFEFFIYFDFFKYLQQAPVKAYHRDKVHCLLEDRELAYR